MNSTCWAFLKRNTSTQGCWGFARNASRLTFFWRYTHEVPHIHQFMKSPVRYLQQMHDRPSAVYLIHTRQRKP